MVRESKNYEEFLELLKVNNISQNAYLSYEYYSIFCKYYPPKKGFICFFVYEDNNLIGLLPLVKRKLDYVILGYRFSNYLGYICDENSLEKVDNEISEYVKKYHKNMIINFYDINDEGSTYQILDMDLLSRKLFLYNCPCCDVSRNFDEVFKQQITKSKKRTELRKFDRKLNELGNIKILNIDTEESWEEGKKYFNQIFKVHAERFADIYIPNELCLHENPEYFTELFENLVKNEKAYISIMLLDDFVISFVYCVVSNGVIMDWMPAFDPAFSRYNLGTVHLMHILEYTCSSEKYHLFDFSKGDDTYKDRWASGETKNFMFVRRFNNNFLAIVKQKSVFAVFAFKSFLREKGILKKIKSLLGSYINVGKRESKDSTPMLVQKYIEKFKYSEIHDFNPYHKKEILDEKYRSLQ